MGVLSSCSAIIVYVKYAHNTGCLANGLISTVITIKMTLHFIGSESHRRGVEVASGPVVQDAHSEHGCTDEGTLKAIKMIIPYDQDQKMEGSISLTSHLGPVNEEDRKRRGSTSIFVTALGHSAQKASRCGDSVPFSLQQQSNVHL